MAVSEVGNGTRAFVFAIARVKFLWVACVLAMTVSRTVAQPPVAGPAVAAQPQKRWSSLVPANFDKAEFSRLNDLHIKIISGKIPFTESVKKDFDSYYNMTFRLMTDPKQLWNLQAVQNKLLKEISTTSADVRNHLIPLTRRRMEQLAAPKTNCHPAVRYTAVLILGQLNDQKEKSGSDPTPAVPSVAARKILLKQFDDPNQVDSVRLAAMIGMLRHAQLHAAKGSMDSSSQNEIRSRMIQLVLTKAPPADRTAAGHDWMRRRAADILGVLGYQGESGAKAAETLIQVLSDRSESIGLRCVAASALGALRPKSPELAAAINPVAVSKELCSLALIACADRLIAANRELLQETGGTYVGGGARMAPGGFDDDDMMGGGGRSRPGVNRMGDGPMSSRAPRTPAAGVLPDDTDPRIERMRRVLRYQLTCVQNGLSVPKANGGVLSRATEESQKAEVKRVIIAVDAVVAIVDRDDPLKDFRKLLADVNKALDELGQIVPDALAANP
ncbi:MAG: hypothetical protein O2931_04785 [Planctomycetota bacterium]|nr:hypothetical protein [Planctomycetota bacterium]